MKAKMLWDVNCCTNMEAARGAADPDHHYLDPGPTPHSDADPDQIF
jgi:hypothetical protein